MPNVIAEIRIVFDGQNVMFHGPMHDKIMCLGMLELAKVIINSNPNSQSKINLGPFPLPPTNGKENAS